MSNLFSRDLRAEAAKHFQGTPGERMETALRLGREALALFHATLPPGTTLDEARDILQRNKHRGRNYSACMESRWK